MEIKGIGFARKICGLGQVERRKFEQQYLKGHKDKGTDACHLLRGGGAWGWDMLLWPLQRRTSREVGRFSKNCAPCLVLTVCPRGLCKR